MDCKQKRVQHQKYGLGTIISQGETNITVQFQNGKLLVFIFPDAFKKPLKFIDNEFQEKVQELIAVKENLKHGNRAHTTEHVFGDEEVPFSEPKPYVTLEDGTHVLFTVSSSRRSVRVHFFKIDNGLVK